MGHEKGRRIAERSQQKGYAFGQRNEKTKSNTKRRNKTGITNSVPEKGNATKLDTAFGYNRAARLQELNKLQPRKKMYRQDKGKDERGVKIRLKDLRIWRRKTIRRMTIPYL
jgi:hypothetical protein